MNADGKHVIKLCLWGACIIGALLIVVVSGRSFFEALPARLQWGIAISGVAFFFGLFLWGANKLENSSKQKEQ